MSLRRGLGDPAERDVVSLRFLCQQVKMLEATGHPDGFPGSVGPDSPRQEALRALFGLRKANQAWPKEGNSSPTTS